MKRNKLLWYAVIGGGLYYLWKKNQPAPVMAVAAPTPATTTVAGFGHMHPWGPGWGGMANWHR